MPGVKLLSYDETAAADKVLLVDAAGNPLITSGKTPFHNEDAAFSNGDGGVLLLGVSNELRNGDVGTDLDYAAIATTRQGNVIVAGQAAHDASIDFAGGQPVAIGGRASSATPTAVNADGDAVWAWFTREGILHIYQGMKGGGDASTSGDGESSALPVAGAIFGYNGGGSYDRIRTQTALGDAATGLGMLTAGNYGYNGASFDRVRTGSQNGDSAATGQLNVLPALKNYSNGTIVQAAQARSITDAETGAYIGIGGSMLYNGATYDRARGNATGTALASAARTGSTNSADIVNYNWRGIVVWLNITSVPGGDTVTLKLSAKDPISGNYASMFTGAALATTGLRTYIVYPGAGSAAIADITGASPFAVPRDWRIEMVHSAASSFTYSVGWAAIL